jgi:hypothetical protein
LEPVTLLPASTVQMRSVRGSCRGRGKSRRSMRGR